MHRIDELGHQDGLFVVGNPATGTPATVVGADWPNAVQEELCAVVEGAGITLEKGNNAQLLAALQVLTGGAGRVIPDPYYRDDQAPASNDLARGCIYFPPDRDAWVWRDIELWRGGVDWELAFELMAATGESANMDWRVAYLLVGAGAANPLEKRRWRGEVTVAEGDTVIPLGTHLNGFYYECTTGGVTASGQPTWPTTAGVTVADGGAVWICRAGGFVGITSVVTPPLNAYQRFDHAGAGLVIPAAEAAAGDRLHLGFWRRGSADAHGGGLLLAQASITPVEAS